ncbi:MAG: hypothetical protein IJC56_01420 [Clostridia bacterium]|nr:hypothetical protein [Clostridia bacterium]
MNGIKLVPGASVQGDSNSRHKQGDILNVRGFYDQDSHVMPESLKEVRKELIEGVECVWQEYVPSGYNGSKKVPLLISMHGGGQSGWGQCYATSWYLVAEREGFIAVFPDAPDRATMEKRRGGAGDEFFDLCCEMVTALIAEMSNKYNIDASRIYMQGMSMGDLETAYFSRKNSGVLAGAGCTAGPTDPDRIVKDGKFIGYTGPVPMYQARGTNDSMSINPKYTRFEVNRLNRKFWMEQNGCEGVIPKLLVDSGECIAYWRGTKADFVYRDVFERGHGQTIDDAERAWQLLFSHTTVENGIIDAGEVPDFADKNAIAVCGGSAKALIDNDIVELPHEVIVREDWTKVPKFMLEGGPRPGPGEKPEMVDKLLGSTMYISVRSLSKLGWLVHENGDTATIRYGGHTIDVAAGNTACIMDGKVESMGRFAEFIDGELYIPAKWMARKVMRMHVCETDGVMYINDKDGELTADMAGIIKEIIG